ncbi:cbb3-type cytochrome oxidase subunit 1 [Alkalibacillus flavidus]|uniref:Cbb3-type cytochrome oxidase subunit 1 n=1 Tax=Alkalibacillus flavidus TaxID=546021 RepID=A0ABV2L0U0_9BACI
MLSTLITYLYAFLILSVYKIIRYIIGLITGKRYDNMPYALEIIAWVIFAAIALIYLGFIIMNPLAALVIITIYGLIFLFIRALYRQIRDEFIKANKQK